MHGFVAECWVIILILAIAGYMFIRNRRRSWAPGVLPLMLVPFVNIIYSPLGRHLSDIRFAYSGLVRTVVYLAALAGAVLWVLLFSKRLPAGRSKYAYIISSECFSAILILIFLVKLPL